MVEKAESRAEKEAEDLKQVIKLAQMSEDQRSVQLEKEWKIKSLQLLTVTVLEQQFTSFGIGLHGSISEITDKMELATLRIVK